MSSPFAAIQKQPRQWFSCFINHCNEPQLITAGQSNIEQGQSQIVRLQNGSEESGLSLNENTLVAVMTVSAFLWKV